MILNPTNITAINHRGVSVNRVYVNGNQWWPLTPTLDRNWHNNSPSLIDNQIRMSDFGMDFTSGEIWSGDYYSVQYDPATGVITLPPETTPYIRAIFAARPRAFQGISEILTSVVGDNPANEEVVYEAPSINRGNFMVGIERRNNQIEAWVQINDDRSYIGVVSPGQVFVYAGQFVIFTPESGGAPMIRACYSLNGSHVISRNYPLIPLPFTPQGNGRRVDGTLPWSGTLTTASNWFDTFYDNWPETSSIYPYNDVGWSRRVTFGIVHQGISPLNSESPAWAFRGDSYDPGSITFNQQALQDPPDPITPPVGASQESPQIQIMVPSDISEGGPAIPVPNESIRLTDLTTGTDGNTVFLINGTHSVTIPGNGDVDYINPSIGAIVLMPDGSYIFNLVGEAINTVQATSGSGTISNNIDPGVSVGNENNGGNSVILEGTIFRISELVLMFMSGFDALSVFIEYSPASDPENYNSLGFLSSGYHGDENGVIEEDVHMIEQPDGSFHLDLQINNTYRFTSWTGSFKIEIVS